jgi:hypothetical protein
LTTSPVGQDHLQAVEHLRMEPRRVGQVPGAMDQYVSPDGGHGGGVGNGVLQGWMILLQVGLEHPLGGSRFHQGIAAPFVHLQDAVHPLHIQDDAALKGPGKAREDQPSPHGDEGNFLPVGQKDDLLHFAGCGRQDYIIRLAGLHGPRVAGVDKPFLRLIGYVLGAHNLRKFLIHVFHRLNPPSFLRPGRSGRGRSSGWA